MKKILLLSLLMASLLTLNAATKTVLVRVEVPERVHYRTISPEGHVELWETKPFVITTDGGHQFWVAPQGSFVGRLIGGMKSKHDWRKTLRRVR